MERSLERISQEEHCGQYSWAEDALLWEHGNGGSLDFASIILRRPVGSLDSRFKLLREIQSLADELTTNLLDKKTIQVWNAFVDCRREDKFEAVPIIEMSRIHKLSKLLRVSPDELYMLLQQIRMTKHFLYFAGIHQNENRTMSLYSATGSVDRTTQTYGSTQLSTIEKVPRIKDRNYSLEELRILYNYKRGSFACTKEQLAANLDRPLQSVQLALHNLNQFHTSAKDALDEGVTLLWSFDTDIWHDYAEKIHCRFINIPLNRKTSALVAQAYNCSGVYILSRLTHIRALKRYLYIAGVHEDEPVSYQQFNVSIGSGSCDVVLHGCNDDDSAIDGDEEIVPGPTCSNKPSAMHNTSLDLPSKELKYNLTEKPITGMYDEVFRVLDHIIATIVTRDTMASVDKSPPDTSESTFRYIVHHPHETYPHNTHSIGIKSPSTFSTAVGGISSSNSCNFSNLPLMSPTSRLQSKGLPYTPAEERIVWQAWIASGRLRCKSSAAIYAELATHLHRSASAVHSYMMHLQALSDRVDVAVPEMGISLVPGKEAFIQWDRYCAETVLNHRKRITFFDAHAVLRLARKHGWDFKRLLRTLEAVREVKRVFAMNAIYDSEDATMCSDVPTGATTAVSVTGYTSAGSSGNDVTTLPPYPIPISPVAAKTAYASRTINTKSPMQQPLTNYALVPYNVPITAATDFPHVANTTSCTDNINSFSTGDFANTNSVSESHAWRPYTAQEDRTIWQTWLATSEAPDKSNTAQQLNRSAESIWNRLHQFIRLRDEANLAVQGGVKLLPANTHRRTWLKLCALSPPVKNSNGAYIHPHICATDYSVLLAHGVVDTVIPQLQAIRTIKWFLDLSGLHVDDSSGGANATAPYSNVPLTTLEPDSDGNTAAVSDAMDTSFVDTSCNTQNTPTLQPPLSVPLTPALHVPAAFVFSLQDDGAIWRVYRQHQQQLLQRSLSPRLQELAGKMGCTFVQIKDRLGELINLHLGLSVQSHSSGRPFTAAEDTVIMEELGGLRINNSDSNSSNTSVNLTTTTSTIVSVSARLHCSVGAVAARLKQLKILHLLDEIDAPPKQALMLDADSRVEIRKRHRPTEHSEDTSSTQTKRARHNIFAQEPTMVFDRSESDSEELSAHFSTEAEDSE